MPYILLGRICGGRQGLDGCLVILIGLYIRKDSCIGFLFGRLVPLGSVGSPVVAMLSMQAVNAVLLQCSSSMHGGRVRCVEGSNHGDVCLVSGGPPVASKGIEKLQLSNLRLQITLHYARLGLAPTHIARPSIVTYNEDLLHISVC